MQPIRYQRRPEVLGKAGLSNSTLCTRIKKGLFVPPVSLGERAVGWLEHEVNACLAAMAEGRSPNEVQDLVRDLVKQRRELAKARGAK